MWESTCVKSLADIIWLRPAALSGGTSLFFFFFFWTHVSFSHLQVKHTQEQHHFFFFLFLSLSLSLWISLAMNLQPVRWQESARLYWIITPDWFHLVHAPALLIWQSCSSAVRNDAQTKRRREKKDRKRESPCLFFFLLFFFVFTLVCFSPLCVSECPSRSPFMNYSAAPPPPPALILAFVPL